MTILKHSSRPIIVFTDGAAKGNPGPGGWAAIIVMPGDRVRELGGGSPYTTNNRMELSGPIESLSHLQATPGRVAVYTDCLLYTSDAADERSSVDLGGRRIIK